MDRSRAEATVEDGAVRVGLSYLVDVGEERARALVAERDRGGPFADLRALAQRSGLPQPALEALVAGGACDCFSPHETGPSRRRLLWELGLVPRSQSVPGTGGGARQLALPLDPTVETPDLPDQTEWERMLADYRVTHVSVGVHPLELLRPHLPPGVVGTRGLAAVRHGEPITVAGMVVARQRPATASGVVFMLLEDEDGQLNLVVPPPVYDRHRAVVRGEPLLLAHGRFERVGRNENVLVSRLETLGPLARRVSGEEGVGAALPDAHHFGRR